MSRKHGRNHGRTGVLAWLVVLLGWVCTPQAQAGSDTLVDPWSSDWHYLADGSWPGAGWKGAAFDDSQWNSGVAPLGYGYPEIVTTTGSTGNVYTSYYRYRFQVQDPGLYDDLSLLALMDDGAVVYINGQEAFRHNLPMGAIARTTTAVDSVVASSAFDTVASVNLPASLLRSGTNTIAIELHQSALNNNHHVFTLLLAGNYPGNKQGIFNRGPYLQMVTPKSAVIRWGTTTKSVSVVHYGTDPDHLDLVATRYGKTYYHEVKLKQLQPGTTYYYSIGTATKTISSGPDQFFKTQPPVGSATPTRIWAIGDSGRNNQNQRDTYQAYRNVAGNTYTDLWLLLGDNAYGNGTDLEYQNGFFNIYPELLRQTVVWPSLGNHDGHSVDTPTQSGVYYSIFTLPTKGQAGGIASGTEAYYSYNYGNIHFVVLDAYDVDRSPDGVMANWLKADLAANTADWVIAYWHHPPYSKGSHDSDWETELIEMRENIVPILESHGADLVLCGHSHNYERSKFVQGHYGDSSTYSDALFAIDTGSGNPLEGAPAYAKAHPAVPNGGTVYAVVGTAAEAGGGSLDHPVMFRSFNRLGTMVIDINQLTLSARFVDEQGVVQDAFTLQKVPGPLKVIQGKVQ